MGTFFDYTDGSTTFEGFAAVDAHTQGLRPCILVCHAWDGPNDYFRNLASELATRGYVAIVIDVYGKGVRGVIDGDNSHLMNPLLADRALLRRRLIAGFEAAKRQPYVDGRRIAALGYCFGGLCALDLARAGPQGLRSVATVHAPLSPPQLGKQAPLTSSIMILHGWDDRTAPPDAVVAVARELTNAEADWQIHAYGHAMHAFTFEGIDLPQLGLKYNPKAAQRARASMLAFLKETLTENE
jgi:dienelactone hydrolase